ncbi:hypothetical protein IBE75_11090, partial [Francisella tularensis]|nr:hypothetical protein [Francisella tularensis]
MYDFKKINNLRGIERETLRVTDELANAKYTKAYLSPLKKCTINIS